jgi:hypothetical protein
MVESMRESKALMLCLISGWEVKKRERGRLGCHNPL